MNFDSLRNKFDKLRNDWAEDSAVDFQFKNKQYSADLGQLALNIPFQHNKYLNHYTDISQIKTSFEFEIRKLVKENVSITLVKQMLKHMLLNHLDLISKQLKR